MGAIANQLGNMVKGRSGGDPGALNSQLTGQPQQSQQNIQMQRQAAPGGSPGLQNQPAASGGKTAPLGNTKGPAGGSPGALSSQLSSGGDFGQEHQAMGQGPSQGQTGGKTPPQGNTGSKSGLGQSHAGGPGGMAGGSMAPPNSASTGVYHPPQGGPTGGMAGGNMGNVGFGGPRGNMFGQMGDQWSGNMGGGFGRDPYYNGPLGVPGQGGGMGYQQGPGGMAGGSMPNPGQAAPGTMTTGVYHPPQGGAQAPPSQGGYTGGPGGFQNAMNAQFGSNNPFSPNANYNVMGENFTGTGGNAALGAGTALGGLANMSTGNQWYGDSPIATAQAAAQQQLDKNLAALQNRYGATGGGNSARAGLASGTAVGEMGTNLGAKLAELGIGARQGDIQNAINARQGAGQLGLGVGNLGLGAGANYNDQVKTALSAMLGAGGLNNDAVKNQLTAAGLMGDMGKNVTGIGAGEQAPANMNSILSLLGMFSGGSTTGGGSASGSQGSGFLGK